MSEQSNATPQVAPERVGESRTEAEVRNKTDQSGKTVLGFGATVVGVFGLVVVLFLVFLIVILTNVAR